MEAQCPPTGSERDALIPCSPARGGGHRPAGQRRRNSAGEIIALKLAVSGSRFRKRVVTNDSQAQDRPVPLVLAQEGSKDRPAQKPGHLQEPRGSQEARACSAVFQAEIAGGGRREGGG